MKIVIDQERFDNRHIGSDDKDIKAMLQRIGVGSLKDLIDQTVPPSIRLKKDLDLPIAKSEFEYLKDLRRISQKNKIFKSFMGLGYNNCFVPSVIQRNILENPGWYTAYTPYQAEIAQGRLEALINYQTMISELTGMELANASLLDEGTAAGEAMAMFHSTAQRKKKGAKKFFVDQWVYPQTIEVVKSRALPQGIELIVDDLANFNPEDPEIFGVLLQYPDSNGEVRDFKDLIEGAHQQNIQVVVAADILSLALLVPPGEMRADAVVGNTQRLGVPIGYGGPHAAYFATREEYKRQIPGRIIGVSMDRFGNKGYRMALQTREQHIRREKATSNICTAEVLLAVIAGMYGVYHGPEGLRRIAGQVHAKAKALHKALKNMGFDQVNQNFFDTLKVKLNSEPEKEKIRQVALGKQVNFRYFPDEHIGITLDETTSLDDLELILSIFSQGSQTDKVSLDQTMLKSPLKLQWPDSLIRVTKFMEHQVFSKYRTEHEFLRYLKKLENKDLSLVHSMIPLGSCTMKLNGTTEMVPITWPEFAEIHPFAPLDQTQGYQIIIDDLSNWLSEITGFSATSLQPNSGAQGEFSGLMVIKAYHESRGEGHRNISLIPSSAHGTNPASSVMAGLQVVIVNCDEMGNIDVEDLRSKATQHKDNLAALMITYPSTHGVFEESIKEICQIIHQNGGQVYMDGANMNAQVGITNPAIIGADVCHLNLHKTFAIPHGGGGPGVGPIGVAEHLKPFLPGHGLIPAGGEKPIHAVSSAPFGSAGVLPISYGYIALMGVKGLKKATEVAILHANYIRVRLEGHYKILYTGTNGRCAHEMIIDCRKFHDSGIQVEDLAKRLMDYGFHAPTVSFPVPGTMMIEPTESESLEELDEFCDALIEIRKEVKDVEDGKVDKDNNMLVNAPHTFEMATSDNWEYPYSRSKAVYPLPFVKEHKFWPSIGRIDNAYGDRNLFCSCIPVEDYQEEEVSV